MQPLAAHPAITMWLEVERGHVMSAQTPGFGAMPLEWKRGTLLGMKQLIEKKLGELE